MASTMQISQKQGSKRFKSITKTIHFAHLGYIIYLWSDSKFGRNLQGSNNSEALSPDYTLYDFNTQASLLSISD